MSYATPPMNFFPDPQWVTSHPQWAPPNLTMSYATPLNDLRYTPNELLHTLNKLRRNPQWEITCVLDFTVWTSFSSLHKWWPQLRTNSMEDNIPLTPANRTVKLPPFWPVNPVAWFAAAEGFFNCLTENSLCLCKRRNKVCRRRLCQLFPRLNRVSPFPFVEPPSTVAHLPMPVRRHSLRNF